MAHNFRNTLAQNCPRAVLFAPSDKVALATKALGTNADAVCLDLEDGVAKAQKQNARAALVDLLDIASQNDKPVFVRVNDTSSPEFAADLGVVPPHIPIVLPKTKARDDIELAARGRQSGVIAMIEDLAALGHLLNDQGTCPDGLIGLALGSEDFCADLGVTPNETLLTHALYDLVKRGGMWGIPVLGMPSSIADYNDIGAFTKAAMAAAHVGAKGAFCIHPAQITALHDGFSPSPEMQEWAAGVIAQASQIETGGTARHPVTGQMLDAPVLEQARALLRIV